MRSPFGNHQTTHSDREEKFVGQPLTLCLTTNPSVSDTRHDMSDKQQAMSAIICRLSDKCRHCQSVVKFNDVFDLDVIWRAYIIFII